jgi:hypothetical protein
MIQNRDITYWDIISVAFDMYTPESRRAGTGPSCFTFTGYIESMDLLCVDIEMQYP